MNMHSIRKNIADIPTEHIHHATTFRKRLISAEEKHKGDIATINYAWLPAGKQLTPHTHPDGEEFYFFLEGKGAMLVGDAWMAVARGDFVAVPAGQLHSVKNPAKEKIVFLTIRTMAV